MFLDNHHVNAHTTASEALWHCVPVVTWPGEALASRVAASLLLAAGAHFACFTCTKVQILAKCLPLASPPPSSSLPVLSVLALLASRGLAKRLPLVSPPSPRWRHPSIYLALLGLLVQKRKRKNTDAEGMVQCRRARRRRPHRAQRG